MKGSLNTAGKGTRFSYASALFNAFVVLALSVFPGKTVAFKLGLEVLVSALVFAFIDSAIKGRGLRP